MVSTPSRDHFWLFYTFQLNLRLGTAKPMCHLNLDNLWMSRSGTSLTENVEILRYKVSEVLACLNKGVSPLACFDWRGWFRAGLPSFRGSHDFEISALNSSSWISIGGGPYPLTLPILNILSLWKQRGSILLVPQYPSSPKDKTSNCRQLRLDTPPYPDTAHTRLPTTPVLNAPRYLDSGGRAYGAGGFRNRTCSTFAPAGCLSLTTP
ncbi:hypothetical protein J6590_035379 [Homalodisca vitripennis]|nr:hypothetical protein J6590_035379 [Homalodisca vitripennis]